MPIMFERWNVRRIVDRWSWRRAAQLIVDQMSAAEADHAFEELLGRPTVAYDSECLDGSIIPREETVRSLLVQRIASLGPAGVCLGCRGDDPDLV